MISLISLYSGPFPKYSRPDHTYAHVRTHARAHTYTQIYIHYLALYNTNVLGNSISSSWHWCTFTGKWQTPPKRLRIILIKPKTFTVSKLGHSINTQLFHVFVRGPVLDDDNWATEYGKSRKFKINGTVLKFTIEPYSGHWLIGSKFTALRNSTSWRLKKKLDRTSGHDGIAW